MAMRVLNQMQREYKPPRADQPEGYSRVYVLPENEQPVGGVWNEADLEELLRKVEASSWKDEPYLPPPPAPTPYPRRGYAGGSVSGQQGQYRVPGGIHFEGNRSSGGEGYRPPSNYGYRPRRENVMQGEPGANPYGHPPFEDLPPRQYRQGGYDPSHSNRYAARPVYPPPNPTENHGWKNRPTYGYQNGYQGGYQNPQQQRGQWPPPQRELHGQNGPPYPTIGNDNVYHQRQPPSMGLGVVVDASYMHQDRPVNTQREPEHVPE
ncbi:hypothetical protein QFC24_001693 [Naganishia onofrii]|uniref:Uncharacterized protein n=1 Tax=Naganishia onofrii TaxID=1851511 RepID=A0ACC2XSR9_9TREE|nr:hypothetical protein QFC24_001693 [Naganishia onofrii]